MTSNRQYDPVTMRLMEMIRHRRKVLGLKVREAAERADMDRSYWTHIETGGRAVQLRTMEAVANAVGLTLTVQPKDAPAPLPVDRQTPDVRANPATEAVRRIVGRIADTRKSLGWSMAEAAARIGWKTHRWRAVELSQSPASTMPLAYLEWAADAVGLRLDAIPPHMDPLLTLDEMEVAWLIGLVRQYHLTVRNPSAIGKRVARKIGERMKAESEVAA